MNKKLTIVCIGLIGLAVGHATEGFGQSRNEVIISSPGAIRSVGQNAASSRLSNYSYGLGGLQSSSVGGGSDILRSSVSGSANFAINRGGAAAASGGDLGSLMSAPAAAFSSKGNAYMGLGTLDLNVAKPGSSGGIANSGLGAAAPNLDASASYLKMLQVDTGGEFKSQKAIVSLVPSEPGAYRDCIERGEAAFKNGDYTRAFTEFRMANTMAGQRDWVSLLSMCHAQFALSMDVYASCALDLRQVLAYCPELPQIAMQPKEFYKDKNKYVASIIRLDRHVHDCPDDPEGAMLLAYFRWFEQDYPAAQSALSTAMAGARQKGQSDMAESIQTFWRGMLSTGKVSGQIDTATQPAPDKDSSTMPSSRPAADGPK